MISRWLTPLLRAPTLGTSLKEVRKYYDELDRVLMMPRCRADKSLTETHKFGQPYSEIVDDNKEFKVRMDVSHFSPGELKVTVKNKCLMIEGKHGEKTDEYGTIERSFVRRYSLPPCLSEENVVSELNEDGILTVGGSKLPFKNNETKNIPIEFK